MSLRPNCIYLESPNSQLLRICSRRTLSRLVGLVIFQMPRISRISGKTGYLPRPRQVVPQVKARYEQIAESKIPTSFQDPDMVPKGSSPNPPGRSVPSVKERIANSSKAPAKARPSKSESQIWKNHISDVRRAYFRDTLQAYEKQEHRNAEKRQRKHERQGAASHRMLDLPDSHAELFTMPSIESSLLQPIVPRTAEETAELKAKRQYNRKLTEFQQRANRDELLLRLYHSTKSFIVTENELEDAVIRTFDSSSGQMPVSPPGLDMSEDRARLQSASSGREALADALMGTVGEDPGLGEVEDALNKR